MRISYSALETFKQCPLKFKFQCIDKIKAPKSSEALFGTLVHKTLKLLHEPTLAPPSEEEILRYFNENWDPAIYPDERQATFAFSEGVKMLKNYYAKNYPAQFNVVALETPFGVPIQTPNQTHLITGKIDRIDKASGDLFEIIDYKTAKKMPPQESVNQDLQLAVYHLGITNRWPVLKEQERPVKVSLYFLKHGEKLSTLKTSRQLEETEENIIKSIESIILSQKTEKFPARPSPLCDWCGYQRHCPLFKHKFIEQKLFFNDQDVKALLNEYIALKDDIDQKDQRLQEIKNNLGKFMDQENMERLFGDDSYITRQVIQRFKYDADLLRQILEPLGRWPEILKVDESKLKRVARELPPNLRSQIDSVKKLNRESKIFSVKKGRK